LDQNFNGSKSPLRPGILYAYIISLPSATTFQPGEQTPIGASPSGLGAELEDPTLPAGFLGAGGNTAVEKAPGICVVTRRGVCPATAKCRSRWIRISGVLCSTARRAGVVDNRSTGEGVVGQHPEVATVENYLSMSSLTRWRWFGNPTRTGKFLEVLDGRGCSPRADNFTKAHFKRGSTFLPVSYLLLQFHQLLLLWDELPTDLIQPRLIYHINHAGCNFSRVMMRGLYSEGKGRGRVDDNIILSVMEYTGAVASSKAFVSFRTI